MIHAMFDAILARVGDIFVGRAAELRRLRGLWTLANEDREHRVYVLLNAPGVGKTTLIAHFGKQIEAAGEGLYLHWRCKGEIETPTGLNADLLYLLQRTLRGKGSLVEAFIHQHYASPERARVSRDLSRVVARVDAILDQPRITLGDTYRVLDRLSWIVPIFLAADEIQELQATRFTGEENDGNDAETGLHYFTRLLKDLLHSRLLFVLSGTRYHILNQIGSKLGSPIQGKVEPLLLEKFGAAEVTAYAMQVRALIDRGFDQQREERDSGTPPPPARPLVDQLMDYYRLFLRAFSGGHPRTIERITGIFLRTLPARLRQPELGSYADFVEEFYPAVQALLQDTLLTTAHREGLLALEASAQLARVRQWITRGATTGLVLGPRPQESSDRLMDDEIKRVVYEVMNLGTIVQNGRQNYHLASQFHLEEFLQAFHGDHEAFLAQVLHNKYFHLMCGRDAGFGFTFEDVVIAAIFLLEEPRTAAANLEPRGYPVDLTRLTRLERVRGKLTGREGAFEPHVLYHAPDAEAVDLVVTGDDHLVAIQVTTARHPRPEKATALLAEVDRVPLEGVPPSDRLAWLISLFPFTAPEASHERVHVTAGTAVIPLLGQALYDRLVAIKASFR